MPRPPASRPSRPKTGDQRSSYKPVSGSRDAGGSAKEDAIRKSAAKAAKRKDWGGVARRGAAWVGREGESTYDEPERAAPVRNNGDEYVIDTTMKSKYKTTSGGAAKRKPRVREKSALSDEAIKEIEKLAGRNAPRMLKYLDQAASAYAAERWSDARMALKPLLENVPDAPVVRELVGLVAYRTGKWKVALIELEASRASTHADQLLPAIMDCYRALKKYDEVEEMWAELRDMSPDAETMADGRIVMASSMAENGYIEKGIDLLEKAPKVKGKAGYHHLRIWYVLADLYERSGDVARARQLFKQVADHDPELADVLDRIETLG